MLPITIVIECTNSEDMQRAIRQAALGQSLVYLIIAPYMGKDILAWDDFLRLLAETREWAVREKLPVELYAGAVLPLRRALDVLQTGSTAYCLADSSYVLLSADDEDHEIAGDILFQLMLKGFQPVLSSPEVILQGKHGLSRLLRWMQKGILTMCDLDSLSGAYGREVREQVQLLVKNNMVCIWGVQAENISEDFALSEQIREIFDVAGLEYGQDMLCRYPEQMRENNVFYPNLPEHVERKKKGLFSWLTGH